MIHSDDLFETVHDRVGCPYVSDLQSEPYRRHAAELMADMRLEGYSRKTLSDMADYLYRETPSFKDAADAEHYFRDKLTIRPVPNFENHADMKRHPFGKKLWRNPFRIKRKPK